MTVTLDNVRGLARSIVERAAEIDRGLDDE